MRPEHQVSGRSHDRWLRACLREAINRHGTLTTATAARIAYGQPPYSKAHYQRARKALSAIAVVIGRDDNSRPGRPLIWARCKP
jgi:hypothetical protein